MDGCGSYGWGPMAIIHGPHSLGSQKKLPREKREEREERRDEQQDNTETKLLSPPSFPTVTNDFKLRAPHSRSFPASLPSWQPADSFIAL